jgi:hypothetical protein
MQRLFFCIAWKFSNRFLCSFLGNISTLDIIYPLIHKPGKCLQKGESPSQIQAPALALYIP